MKPSKSAKAPGLAISIVGAETVPLATIERDPAINCRAGGTDERIATEYAQAFRDGAKLPPVVAFRDADGKLWLADGFHRCRAADLAGLESIDVDVRAGARRDALLFAAGANATHGTRRTNADKRRAVETLLADEEWQAKSDRWIAEQCAVSDRFVNVIRARHDATANDSQLGKRVGRDGKERPAGKRAKRQAFSATRAAKQAAREIERVARGWPKGEPVEPLLAALQACIQSLAGRQEGQSNG